MKYLISFIILCFAISAFAKAEEKTFSKQKESSNLEEFLVDLDDYKAKFPAKKTTDSIIALLKEHKESFFQNKDEVSYFFVTFGSEEGFSFINEIVPLNLKDNVLTASIYKEGSILSFYGELSEGKKAIKVSISIKELKLEGFSTQSGLKEQAEDVPIFNRKEINNTLCLPLNESAGVVLGALSSERVAIQNGKEVRLKTSSGYGIFVVYPNAQNPVK